MYLLRVSIVHMAASATEHAKALLTGMANECADAVADLSDHKSELKRNQQCISRDIRNLQRKRARLLDKAQGLGDALPLNAIQVGAAAKAKAEAKSSAN